MRDTSAGGSAIRSLSIREARRALGRLDELLADGGAVTIAKRGRAVARIVPLARPRPPSHRALRDCMRRLDRPSESLVREDRDR